MTGVLKSQFFGGGPVTAVVRRPAISSPQPVRTAILKPQGVPCARPLVRALGVQAREQMAKRPSVYLFLPTKRLPTEVTMVRRAALILSQLMFTATCAATPIDLVLELAPSMPDPATEITLRLSAEQVWVAVDGSVASDVEFTDQTILVSVSLTPSQSEIRFPSAEPLDITVDLGPFPTGTYDVQAQLFGETGELFGSGTSNLTIVPEPSGALLAFIALAGAVALGRLTSRSS